MILFMMFKCADFKQFTFMWSLILFQAAAKQRHERSSLSQSR